MSLYPEDDEMDEDDLDEADIEDGGGPEEDPDDLDGEPGRRQMPDESELEIRREECR